MRRRIRTLKQAEELIGSLFGSLHYDRFTGWQAWGDRGDSGDYSIHALGRTPVKAAEALRVAILKYKKEQRDIVAQ